MVYENTFMNPFLASCAFYMPYDKSAT